MFTSRTVTLRLPVNKNDNSNIFRRLPMFQSSVIFGILTGSKLLGIEILKQKCIKFVNIAQLAAHARITKSSFLPFRTDVDI